MNARDFAASVYRFAAHPAKYQLTERLFLRLLGLTYLLAFASLLPQVRALFGSRGIVPVASVLAEAHRELGGRAYALVPTLFWFGAPDGALVLLCIFGCLAGVMLALSILPRLSALVAWMLYLSITSVGAPFTNFQWDALLLEAGFLALFSGASLVVWAYRFLLFRLMFESGLVKLTSGDPNWTNLHALRFHFLTQPLPMPLSWYASHWSSRVLDSLTAFTLLVELVAPFLLFGPRLARQVSVVLLIALQISILLTGNYGFFNFLTIALCVWGLDDSMLRPLARFLRTPSKSPRPAARTVVILCNVALSFLLIMGASQLFEMIPSARPSGTLNGVARLLAPFELVNTYGLFAVMTTAREEIVLQGSNDGEHWLDYEFPFKPGQVNRTLPIVAPYMPRLDWQMWFAALGSFNENRWVGNLMYRLLVGEPAVTRLLEKPPFPKAPRYMRAELYDYTFTTAAERARTGAIWKRQLRGDWFGPVSLTGR